MPLLTRMNPLTTTINHLTSVEGTRVRGSAEPYLTERQSWYHRGYWWRPDYSNSGEGSGTAIVRQETRLIQDVYEAYGKGVWPFKPVHAIKISVQSPLVTITGGPILHGPYSGHRHQGTVGLGIELSTNPWHPDGSYKLSWDASQIDEGRLMRRLADRMEAKLPSLKSGAPDLAVFLLELRDVKSLFQRQRAVIGSLIRRLAKGKTNSSYVVVRGGRKARKSQLKHWAEQRLQKNFVDRPTVSEIGKLASTVSVLCRKWLALRDGVGKVHDIHVSVSDVAGNDKTYPFCPQSVGGAGTHGFECPYEGGGTRVHASGKLQLGATLKYSYTLPPLSGLFDKLEAGLLSLGFQPGFSVLWEIIPFSFVIDWWFNTDRLFRALRLDTLGFRDVKVRIIDFCWTRKAQDLYYATVNEPCRGGEFLAYERRVESFDRYVESVDKFLRRMPWVKWPTLAQWLNGLALGVALA